ncbi:MAG: putative DNA-binding domain-containing protein [Pseudomonadota bacterium]
MTLLALQRDFRAGLLGPAEAAHARMAGDASKGFGVYRTAYRLRLRNCLRETYEQTWAWLGDEAFDSLCARYIETHPPQAWTLGEYGERLANLAAILYPDDPEIAELCRLEWALRRAFDGPDATTLKLQDCADVDWDAIALRFVSTLSLSGVAANSGALWTAMKEGAAPPPVELYEKPAAIVVWRKDLSPSFRTIEGTELSALRFALAGFSFGEVCRLASNGAAGEAAIAEIGACLARWFNDEMISGVAALT